MPLHSFNRLRQNLSLSGVEILLLLLGLMHEILVGRDGDLGTLIAILITMVVVIILGFSNQQQRWMFYLRYFLVICIAVLLIFTLVPPLREWQQDMRSRFPKTGKNSVNVLFADFGSDEKQDGDKFTDSLHKRFDNDCSMHEVKIADTSYAITINAKRTNQVWTKEKMYARGKRRHADIGVIGTYKIVQSGLPTSDVVKGLQCIILNDSLASALDVFDSKNPLDSLYEFIVTPRDLLCLAEKVSKPICYISNAAVNLQLLRIALDEKNEDRHREILQRVDSNFVDIGNLVGDFAVSSFHQGKCYFRTAGLSTDHAASVKMYLKAVSSFQESINFQKNNSRHGIVKYNVENTFFNLSRTYKKLHTLKPKETWLDSAEVTYEQAALTLNTYSTVHELFNFLDERLGKDYDEENQISRIPITLFEDRIAKLSYWGEVLIDKVRAVDPDEDEEERNIMRILAMWEARLRDCQRKNSL